MSTCDLRISVFPWAFTLFSSAALLGACAPASPSASRVVSQTTAPEFPAPKAGEAPYSNVNGVANPLLDSILGSYTTTLVRRDPISGASQQQAAQIQIQKVQVSGSSDSYLYARFRSSGSIGSLSFETFLGYGMNGSLGAVSLMTPALSVAALSDSALAFEFVLPLKSATQVDPTRSAIFIKECVFAQYLGCGTPAEDVWFESNRLSKP